VSPNSKTSPGERGYVLVFVSPQGHKLTDENIEQIKTLMPAPLLATVTCAWEKNVPLDMDFWSALTEARIEIRKGYGNSRGVFVVQTGPDVAAFYLGRLFRPSVDGDVIFLERRRDGTYEIGVSDEIKKQS